MPPTIIAIVQLRCDQLERSAAAHDHSSGLHHLREDQSRFTRGDDQNVSQYCELGEIACFRMTDTYGGIPLHEHQCHRLADYVAGTHNDHILALDLDSLVLKELDDPS
jgi:hypothetical protein